MWKAYTMLAGLLIGIVVVTGYAIDTIESPAGKPQASSAFTNRLSEGIRTEYNAREQAKSEPFRAVKVTCAHAGQDLYNCRALTLSPAGVDCILLVVYAKGDKSFTVQAASTDPSCPEGDKA